MKKFVRLALFLALAIVLSIAESYIPFFNGIVPGLKIGLANVVILFVLYYYSIKEAAFISILRVLVVGLLRTGLFSVTFIFSLTGAIFALVFMYLAHRFFKFSVIGVSVVGSVMHTIGQLICVAIMFNTANLSFYIPIVLLIALPTGIIVGYLADKVIDLMYKIDKVEREDVIVFEDVEDTIETPIDELIDVTQKIPTLKELVDASNEELINNITEEEINPIASDVEIISKDIEMPLESEENIEVKNDDESVASVYDTVPETSDDISIPDLNNEDNINASTSNDIKSREITDWDMPVIENNETKKNDQKKTTTSSKPKKKSNKKKK